jgi:PGF-CTERM protein
VKRKKMKTRSKGKAIISIAMAVIMLASVALVLALPLPDSDYNGLTYEITPNAARVDTSNASSATVIIGQNLDFGVGAKNLPVKGDPTTSTTAGEVFSTSSSGKFDTSVLSVTGTYYLDPEGGSSTVTPTKCRAVISASRPVMNLDLRVKDKSVTTITQGTDLEIYFVNNLGDKDMVTLQIIDPDGNQIKSTVTPIQKFSKINVKTISDSYALTGVDTTDWKVGAYTFLIKTDKEADVGKGARGLVASSDVEPLTIIKSEVAIEADKTTVAEEERVRLTVTGVTDHVVEIRSSDWGTAPDLHTIFPGGIDDNPTSGTSAPFTTKIDADGMRKFAVKFQDTGSYTITVVDTSVTPTLRDTVDITVLEKVATFDIPSLVMLGEKLTIEGTVNTGDWVAVAFDDVVPPGFNKLTIDSNNEFSKNINTGQDSESTRLKAPGSIRLKAFINLNVAGGTDITTMDPEPLDDGSTAILLSTGALNANISTDAVATGDDFKVEGTLQGPREVEILTVSPKGMSGKGMRATPAINSPGGDPYTGCTYDRTSVSETDYSFTKKLDVRDTADTGTYLVVVLSSGIDGEYGDNQGAPLPVALANKYGDMSTKTQSQVESMLVALTSEAGSDDLIWMGGIKVATPMVLLDPITSVRAGELLSVTGKSNRKAGYVIVVTAKGPLGVELEPVTVAVAADGTFEATFDTTNAPVGEYTVKADDGDGHTDDAKVLITVAAEIVEGVEKVVTTVEEAAAAAAEELKKKVDEEAAAAAAAEVERLAKEAAEAAAEATPEPPGFEAIFAIAGLLAVAYLVHRRKH